MPSYRFLLDEPLDLSLASTKVKAMRRLGVPYSDAEEKGAADIARAQAKRIGEGLAKEGAAGMEDKEITALIAYLQRLGRDIQSQSAGAVAQGVKP
jgi:cytochrome c oxidase cbb3-type subunit I/II